MSTNKLVKSNSRKATKYRGVECLNCGQPLDLSDVYCPYCSQLNSTKQLSFKDFFGEFINSIVSYDSRLRYTVKDLLFRPGTITYNYVTGRRLRYANPFRFFLSVSIIYFILNGLISTFIPSETPVNFNKSNDSVVTYSYGEDTYDLEGQKITEDANKAISADSIDPASVAVENDTTEKELDYISEKDLDTLSAGERITRRIILYNDFYKKHEVNDASTALKSLNHENTWFNRWLYQKTDVIDRIKNNPIKFANYLAAKIPFFLFFFTPFFALFFWLLYSRKRYSYIEHMIFIFHIFSFLFLAMLLCLLPDLLIGEDVLMGITLMLIGPFYFYKALRNFYKQGRFVTLIKFVFLNIIFWCSASIAAILFFAITAAVY
ncbi:DUF3667 domain-containing protein [Candidatus Ulvibacter alkanivorans]|uniref:DUF3667 domain-containing protein n=1 Tax=Candidatus Ulvibacter alkanivorans TaxID=2267620 RepID=UPI001443D999|nr:DUF3667 domain-containing protein [Candidatus Ulvibacter alkanivorans]